MVTINIPDIRKHLVYTGDGSTTEFTIDQYAREIEVIISGIYLTNGEDFSYEDDTLTLEEVPEDDSNINIKYII